MNAKVHMTISDDEYLTAMDAYIKRAHDARDKVKLSGFAKIVEEMIAKSIMKSKESEAALVKISLNVMSYCLVTNINNMECDRNLAQALCLSLDMIIKNDILMYQNKILMDSISYYKENYVRKYIKYSTKYKTICNELKLYGIPYEDTDCE